MSKVRLATAWLGGCSGCHMSFLDMDAWLFDLAAVADVVYSPIADVKVFPPDVDITLVEGAVANEDNAELARDIRANSKVVVSFGDCAVTGNVTAMRNPLGDPAGILEAVYVEAPDRDGMLPVEAGNRSTPPAPGAPPAQGDQGRRISARVPAAGGPDSARG